METALPALRQNFADRASWGEMARARGIRLPASTVRPNPRLMRRWLRRLGVSVEDYLRFSGERTLRDFARNNPDWPLVAWVGIVLDSVIVPSVPCEERARIDETPQSVLVDVYPNLTAIAGRTAQLEGEAH